MASRSSSGFSLMEVLVAVSIVGIALATLFSLISTSLHNVARIGEREKVIRLGQMKLNELLIEIGEGRLPSQLSGRFDEKYRWRAQLETFDTGPEMDKAPDFTVSKIRLTVQWEGRMQQQNEYTLETLSWIPNG